MKKLYILLVFVSQGLAFAQTNISIDWQRSFGGSGHDSAKDIVSTNDGGYIVVGTTESSDGDVINSYGNYDYWLLKLDQLGNILWQKSYGGSDFDVAHSVKPTTDNGFIICGETASTDGDVTGNNGFNDYWLVKVDSSGNILWQKCYGGSSNDRAFSVQQTMDGGFIICGESNSGNGDVTGNNGSHDYWIVKVDSVGSIQWEKSLGGLQFEGAYSIIETNTGEFVVIGYSDSNSGMVTCNHTTMQGNASTDNWVVKLDSAGNIIWHKCLGGSITDIGYSLIQSSDGNYIMTGWTMSNNGDVSGNHGSDDFWVVKLDTSSNILWQKCYGGSSFDKAYVIKEAINGGYLIGGTTNSKNGDLVNFNYWNYWVIKIDTAGTIEWQKSFGGTNADKILGITEDLNGDVVVVGNAYSNDGDVSGNHGDDDFWIVKLTNGFNIISGNSFLDLNGNFTKDTGEANIINNHVSESNTGRITFTNSAGYYYLNVLDTGNFSVSTNSLPYYVPAPSVHNIAFSNINQTDSINNFAFLSIGTYNDLKITLTPVGSFRPGFDSHYNISYKNIGTTSMTGTVVFYPDSNLTFATSLPLPSINTSDSIVWNTATLNPYDEGSILVTLIVSPTTTIGSLINSVCKIEPISGDADQNNNFAEYITEVTGSFDPNDILVNRDKILTSELQNPPLLEYLIRFQNTGNDTAFTVKLLNNLTERLNISSFELVNSSHPVQLNYYYHSRLMEFVFDNIFLPDSNTNELLSHGFIRYKINPISNLSLGDSIENSAAIYFDFNAPVITNSAVTEIVIPISTPEIQDNFNFSLFPNPTHGELNALFTVRNDVTVEMQVFNNLGQIVKTISGEKMKAGNNKITFSTENMHPGIYHLQLLIDGEAITRKLVKM